MTASPAAWQRVAHAPSAITAFFERHARCKAARVRRRTFIELSLLLVVGCGGSIAQPIEDAGACEAGAYPVECPGGPLLYCCPPGSHCEAPSCGEPAEAGACADGEVLLEPCCGGYQDQSCSNGPGPPPPFCIALPASCEGKSSCTIGGCSGQLDETTGTLGCGCL
ncbi:MAG TPA: hypothetical protein VGH28_02355 [Polyangiaceae bacterium]